MVLIALRLLAFCRLSHYAKPLPLSPNQFINISGVTLEDSSTDFGSKVKIPSTSSSSNFKMMAGSTRLRSSKLDSDSDAAALKVDRRRGNGVENEISTLSPNKYLTNRDLYYRVGSTAGIGNDGFSGDVPRTSFLPPYKEESSSNMMTGVPDLGAKWSTKMTRQSSSSNGNGVKSPSVRFSPGLKFQTSNALDSTPSDDRKAKMPRPPLDVTFI